MNPKNIVNLEQLEFVTEGKTEPYRYDIAPEALASRAGARKLGWNVTRLPAGQFSCPYHFHHSEEELFLIIDGLARLRTPEGFREVRKGDLIFFTTGAEGAHQFYNHTSQPFTYLALSTKDELEVCEYPDSKKIRVGKLKLNFEASDAVEYDLGETNPALHWPKEQLAPKP